MFAKSIVLFCLSMLLMGCAELRLLNNPSAGRLAYIGPDGNVYLSEISPLGKVIQAAQVTTDATAPMEGNGRSYHRLAWSKDGQLAFAAMNRTVDAVEGQLYVSPLSGGVLDAPVLVGEGDDSYVIYIYWSPGVCDVEMECHRIAYLEASQETMVLRLVSWNGLEGADHPTEIANRQLTTGRPIYYGWSGDGERLLWHVNGSAFWEPKAQIATFDMAAQQVFPLDLRPASFLAPAWSPTGQEWLGVTSVQGQDESPAGELRLFDQSGSRLIAEVPIGAQYVWAPDGKRFLYAQRQDAGSGRFGSLYLYDVDTGETRQVTSTTRDALGFFWSPGGTKVAYINDLRSPDPRWVQWRVVDLSSGVERGYKAFRAGHSLRFMLGSFSQYAQSHSFWSPDGRYLSYVDEDATLVERIWLIDTQNEDGREPLIVATGALAIWAWHK